MPSLLLNHHSLEEITLKSFEDFGEEKESYRIAQAIVRAREENRCITH
jgi:16S rRNA C1402 N4-methylase RsmH